MKIRLYAPSDRTACLALFDGNVGQFFDPSERSLFDNYLGLERYMRDFYVVEEEGGEIVACGGTMELEPGLHDLSWGMARRDSHGRGIGRALLEYRLENMRERFGAVRVRCETSQHTRGFFERFGFVAQEVKPDGFGPGIDWVLLERPADEPLPA